MARYLASHDGGARHPIQLHHAAGTGIGLEAVPRILLILEQKQRAGIGRHFRDDIIQIVRRLRTSAGAVPSGSPSASFM